MKAQWRQVPRRGLGYGLLHEGPAGSTLVPHARPDVVFNYLGQFDQVWQADAGWGGTPESTGPTRSPAAPRPHLLEITASIAGGQLRWAWTYCPHVHAPATVERLARACAAHLDALISADAGGRRASDFPLVELTADEIEHLSGVLDEPF